MEKCGFREYYTIFIVNIGQTGMQANGADPDPILQSAASYQSLHCLQVLQ